MKKQLYINGTGSGTCGVYLNSDTFLNSPAIDFTEYQIPAVNGNQITYNKRLNNVIRKFDCFINENVETNLTKFKKLLYESNGYMKLESDYDTDTYQMGYLAQEIQVDPFRETKQIKFSLYFSCMPQKWYKTNNSANVTTNYAMSQNIFTVEHRSNERLQGVFSQMPIDDQPTAEYYMVVRVDYNVLTHETITNASFSETNGSLIIFADYNSVYKYSSYWVRSSHLISYGYGSTSIASYETPSTGNNTLHLIVPITSDIVLSGSVITSNGTQTVSVDSSTYRTTVSNSDAFGLDMDYELEINYDSGSGAVTTSVIVDSFLNSVKQNETLFMIDFDSFTADMWTEIANNYVTSNLFKVVISADNTAAIVKGTDAMDITSYLIMTGSINERGDSARATVFYEIGGKGSTHKLTMNPRWWKL